MQKIARRLLPLLVLALATGCRDSAEADDGGPGLPTEPLPIADQQSSTCRAYVASLDGARAALERTPGDPLLEERVAVFSAIIADACN